MDEKKYLEDKEVSDDELQKLRETLSKDQRLIETTPNHFKVLKRLAE